jgi:carbon starvation protein
MGIWYHFAILFEALFILTTVDAGTRVARFMIQDMIGSLIPSFRRTDSWSNTIIGSALAVGAWGYFLFQGVIDPMGGINTLWPLFGISNQMLAGIALILCTVVLIKMKRQRYIWVTAIPTLWLLTCTLTAGLQKLLSSVPAIGFLSHARLFGAAADAGRVLPPAKTLEEMNRIIFNDYVDAALAALFIAVLLAVALYGVMALRKALADPKVSAVEVGVGAVAGATHV